MFHLADIVISNAISTDVLAADFLFAKQKRGKGEVSPYTSAFQNELEPLGIRIKTSARPKPGGKNMKETFKSYCFCEHDLKLNLSMEYEKCIRGNDLPWAVESNCFQCFQAAGVVIPDALQEAEKPEEYGENHLQVAIRNKKSKKLNTDLKSIGFVRFLNTAMNNIVNKQCKGLAKDQKSGHKLSPAHVGTAILNASMQLSQLALRYQTAFDVRDDQENNEEENEEVKEGNQEEIEVEQNEEEEENEEDKEEEVKEGNKEEESEAEQKEEDEEEKEEDEEEDEKASDEEEEEQEDKDEGEKENVNYEPKLKKPKTEPIPNRTRRAENVYSRNYVLMSKGNIM